MILIKNPSSWVKSSIFCSWPCVFLLLFMAVANIEVRARPLPRYDTSTSSTIKNAPPIPLPTAFDEGSVFSKQASIIKGEASKPEHSSKISAALKDDVRGVDDTSFWKGVNDTNYKAFYKKLSFAVDDFLTNLDCSSLQEFGAGTGRQEYASVLKEFEIFLLCSKYNRNPNTEVHKPDLSLILIQVLSHGDYWGTLDITNKPVNLAEPEWKLSLYIAYPAPFEFLNVLFTYLDKDNLNGVTFTFSLDAAEQDEVNRNFKSYLKSMMSNLGYTEDLEKVWTVKFKKNDPTTTTTTTTTMIPTKITKSRWLTAFEYLANNPWFYLCLGYFLGLPSDRRR